MRVVVPFTDFRPEVAVVLADADFVRMTDDEHYHRLLAELWSQREAFAIVEHDVVVHDSVLAEFADCPELWCAFPYLYCGETVVGLGCVRFRADILLATPDLFTQVRASPEYNGHGPSHWCVQDGWISYLLHLAGFRPHVHYPSVTHLNATRSHGCGSAAAAVTLVPTTEDRMATYTNTDDHHRTWIGLQVEDGTTLSLEPGESVDLDLPDDFEDPYLKPAVAIPAKIAAPSTPPAPPADAAVTTPKE